jgi:tetratricopeptide (TPR) repeat protein
MSLIRIPVITFCHHISNFFDLSLLSAIASSSNLYLSTAMRRILSLVLFLATACSTMQAQSKESLISKARREFKSNDFLTARIYLDVLISQDSCQYEPLILRGRCQLLLKDSSYALADFNQAVRCQPDSADGYFFRGVVRKSTNNFSRALNDFNKAVSINPRSDMYLLYRGITLGLLKDYPSAIADLDSSLSIKPNDYTAYLHRGLFQGRAGNLKASVADLGKALSILPTSDIHFERGKVFLQLNNSDSALAEFNKAVDLNAANGTLFLTRAKLFMDKGRKSEGFLDLVAARKLGFVEEAAALLNKYNSSYSDRKTLDSLRTYLVPEIEVKADREEVKVAIQEAKTITKRANNTIVTGFNAIGAPRDDFDQTGTNTINALFVDATNCNKNIIKTRRSSRIPLQCLVFLLQKEALVIRNPDLSELVAKLADTTTEIIAQEDLVRRQILLSKVQQYLIEVDEMLSKPLTNKPKQ